jgi:uroporphyrinogen-III synthase
MIVWIARAEPGASETAARLLTLGHTALVDPVLTVRAVTDHIAFDGMGAIAFTSRNGVDAFARLSTARDLPVFAVGDATADAARAVGFGDVRSAEGDVEALARLIGETHDPAKGAVLCIGPTEPSADLGRLLGPYKLNAASLAVYETGAAQPTQALARLAEIGTVLVHSPKAAQCLAELLDPASTRHLAFACISAKAAAPLLAAGYEKVAHALFPDEAALLKLIDDR